MRVAPEAELQGLDYHEVSAPAYPGDGAGLGSSVMVFQMPRVDPAKATRPATRAMQEIGL